METAQVGIVSERDAGGIPRPYWLPYKRHRSSGMRKEAKSEVELAKQKPSKGNQDNVGQVAGQQLTSPKAGVFVLDWISRVPSLSLQATRTYQASSYQASS